MTAISSTHRVHQVHPVAGDALLHPFALVALVALLLNDHVLKPSVPGWWTGKLSDVAALVVLALVVQAVAEVLGAPVNQRVLAASLIASGLALVAIKLLPLAGTFYRWGLGAAQWVPAAGGAILDGVPAPAVVPAALTRDPTDLMTLPILLVTWLVFRERGPQRSSRSHQGTKSGRNRSSVAARETQDPIVDTVRGRDVERSIGTDNHRP